MSVELVNRVALIAFILGLLLGAVSVAWRMVQLRRAGIRLPRLIWRDVTLVGGLGGSFVAIGVHRALGEPFRGQLWWALLLAGIAVGAVWTFVWFEVLVIGHRRDGRHEHGDDEP